MLKPTAFANAVAILSGLFYVVFSILKLGAPAAFAYLFNTQFFGADVARLVPEMTFGTFLATLVVFLVLGWIFGYVFAWLYNRFAR